MTMTMMMMQRMIESAHKNHEKTNNNNSQLLQEKLDFEKRSPEPQLFLQPKRIEDDSRDVEMCENKSYSDEEDLNVEVDVENDESLCPVDLTRSRQDMFTFERIKVPSENSDFSGFKKLKEDDVNAISVKRAESVCSDVSRSESPRDESPSVVSHQNRRLAFSVENILDPNKFTGRQSVYSDGVCCWKPHQESLGSPEYEGSDTGMFSLKKNLSNNFHLICNKNYLFNYY